MSKRIKWETEEMVAMVDLYFRHKNNSVSDLESEFEKLSTKLNKRADKLGIIHDNKYRNMNGMRMIFENVKSIDTDGIHGLSGKSLLMIKVVELYHTNEYIFNKILDEFNLKY